MMWDVITALPAVAAALKTDASDTGMEVQSVMDGV